MSDRYYSIKLPDGNTVSLPSVTSILSVIDSRALTNWKVKVGQEEVDRISQDTSGIGSQGHSLIQRISSGGIIGKAEWDALDERVRNGVRAAVRWQRQVGFIPKHTEMVVYSLEFGYAGMLDVVGTRKPRIPSIADYKLARQIYKEGAFAQLVAYKHAYLEMFPKRRIDELWAVRLDKLTGIPDPQLVKNEELFWQIFLSALTIFKSRITISEGGDNGN